MNTHKKLQQRVEATGTKAQPQSMNAADLVVVLLHSAERLGCDRPTFRKIYRRGFAGPALQDAVGIDVATIVPVKRQLKQEFGFTTPGASDPYQSPTDGRRETEMVTGDLNAALVEWVVQYRISDPASSCSRSASRARPCATSRNP
jgi:hypothetical protein